MKLNWVERGLVNNPLRRAGQYLEIQWFKSTLPVNAGAKILEIGCGRGAGAALILEKFQPASLYLLDLDPQMMRKAKAYLSTHAHANISFYVGDAVCLPFKEACLDAVFGFGFLHHVPGWRSGLAEIARVLKTGGVYYLEELYPSLYRNFITKNILVHPESDRFNSHDLREAFARNALTLQHTFELKKMGILGIGVKTR
ncbi:MAG: class I SAM-dependent methyltransferase [Desulfobacterales bacterium]|nr:MAG: class I SAM-dependent methyltransferase [Desulfobacterales bacterium]